MKRTDASPVPSLSAVQAVGVPVGGGAVFEVRLAEPAGAAKGALGVLRAK